MADSSMTTSFPKSFQPLQLPDPAAMVATLGPIAPQPIFPAAFPVPLQDVTANGAGVPDPASVHVSSDDAMNLSRELADIMDRELFEEACQHREVQFEE